MYTVLIMINFFQKLKNDQDILKSEKKWFLLFFIFRNKLITLF